MAVPLSPARPAGGAAGAAVSGAGAGRRARTAGPAPSRVALVALAAAVAFVALRLLLHGGDPTTFVHAGDRFTEPAAAERLVVEHESSGYDGQFSHRLARAPLSSADRVDGVGFDRPVDRTARIGYPLLAWAASLGGRAALVPWALIGVNLAALAAVAGFGAVLARDAGRTSWLGLLPAATPGLVVALSRDLTEVVAAAGLLGAVVLLRRERWLAAALAMTGAALTRETTLVLAAAVVGVAVLARLPERTPAWARRPARALLGDGAAAGAGPPVWVGAVPLLAYGAWQAWLRAAWAAPTAYGADDPTNGVTVPFVRPLVQVVRFAAGAGELADLVQLLQLLLVGAAVAVAVVAALRGGAGVGGHERLALLLAAALLVSLTTWDRAVVFLRYPSDVLVLAAAVVPAAGLGRPMARVTAPLLGLAAFMWLLVA